MADTFTANLALTKPEVGASADTWGNKLNDNLDAIDGLFPSGALPVNKGGTGSTTQAGARTSLGLGAMATQDSANVSITGGSAAVGSFAISGTAPQEYYIETDAAVDNKRWSWVADGASFALRLHNDAVTSYNNALTITRSGTSPSVCNFGAVLQVSGNVVYHAGNLSTAAVAETQITDGTLLARVGSNETISGTWSYTTMPIKTGGGKFLAYAAATNNGGTITVSTTTPSGTPADGDIWIQRAA